jgi:hypothetical protein
MPSPGPPLQNIKVLSKQFSYILLYYIITSLASVLRLVHYFHSPYPTTFILYIMTSFFILPYNTNIKILPIGCIISFALFPVASAWSIRHPWNASFHSSFLILRQLVELLGRGISPSQGRYRVYYVQFKWLPPENFEWLSSIMSRKIMLPLSYCDKLTL